MDTEILAVDGQSGEAPSPFVPGQPLIRRPRHQASVDVAGSRGRLSGYVRLIARGRVLDVDPSYGGFGGVYEADGYTAAHLGARVALTRLIDVFGRVDNLFDGAYEEALGYPALGRTAYVGVRIASRR
jgi:outer membrane cobalamin receptor